MNFSLVFGIFMNCMCDTRSSTYNRLNKGVITTIIGMVLLDLQKTFVAADHAIRLKKLKVLESLCFGLDRRAHKYIF